MEKVFSNTTFVQREMYQDVSPIISSSYFDSLLLGQVLNMRAKGMPRANSLVDHIVRDADLLLKPITVIYSKYVLIH